MKIFVIGCGSIGERHIKNLLSLGYRDVLCFDISSERRKTMEKYGVKVVNNREQGFKENPDATLICTPTAFHIEPALMALENGSHVFIEKPISHTLDGVDNLIETAEKRGLIVMVGYNLRFNQSLCTIKKLLEANVIGNVISARVEMGQYLPDYHPWRDYRKEYSARKDMGGGVILDAIHELDYTQWFFGDVNSVFSVADKMSTLEIETEDLAEIILKFKNNVVANVHLDYIQRAYSRGCKIIGEEGTILWNYLERMVRVFSAKGRKWKIYRENMKKELADAYVDELRYFLECVKKGVNPESDGNNGKKTLMLALAAKESARIGKVVNL
jgi:predicted dehydrogenase